MRTLTRREDAGDTLTADARPQIAGASPAVPTGGAGQNAIVTLTSTATGGSFKLGLDGTATPAIPFNATGQTVQGAIQQALAQFQGGGSGQGNPTIPVAGPAGGPWVITVPPNYVGRLKANTAGITIDNTLATGGAVTQALTQQGLSASDTLQGSGEQTSEAPRVVGAANQVSYATGWSSPAGSSVALTQPTAASARTDWEPLQYFMDDDGYVHIEGVAVWGAGAAALITTLPVNTNSGGVNYAPAASEEQGLVRVGPDGTLTYLGSTTSAGAVSIQASYRPAGI